MQFILFIRNYYVREEKIEDLSYLILNVISENRNIEEGFVVLDSAIICYKYYKSFASSVNVNYYIKRCR